MTIFDFVVNTVVKCYISMEFFTARLIGTNTYIHDSSFALKKFSGMLESRNVLTHLNNHFA